jgi:predicted nucleic acid-binding protein
LSSFVLDASTAVSWCFEEVQTPYAMAILERIAEGSEVHVPLIWPLEVTNALIKALRRRHITREELFDYAQQLAGLRVKVDLEAAARAFGEVLALAERRQLTTYDAAYLELAQRLGLEIATADGNLIQAAAAEKVPVFRREP